MLTSHAHNIDAPSLPVLLTAFTDHLVRHGLPEPASLRVDLDRPIVECQPSNYDPGTLLPELLAWADSMHAATITLVRLGSGAMHLHIAGTLSGGIQARLFTSATWSLLAPHLDELDRAGTVQLTPAELRTALVTESGVIA